MEISDPAPTEDGAETATEGRSRGPRAFDEIETDAPLVGIIMGSKSDMEKMRKAEEVLEEYGIRCEIRVMSAHRDPDTVSEYCKNARMRGLKVIIAGAGMSAALPGVAAAHTDLPVIGVPIDVRPDRRDRRAALGRADAARRPGRCVAIDGAKNAGHLAARIINL